MKQLKEPSKNRTFKYFVPRSVRLKRTRFIVIYRTMAASCAISMFFIRNFSIQTAWTIAPVPKCDFVRQKRRTKNKNKKTRNESPLSS